MTLLIAGFFMISLKNYMIFIIFSGRTWSKKWRIISSWIECSYGFYETLSNDFLIRGIPCGRNCLSLFKWDCFKCHVFQSNRPLQSWTTRYAFKIKLIKSESNQIKLIPIRSNPIKLIPIGLIKLIKLIKLVQMEKSD